MFQFTLQFGHSPAPASLLLSSLPAGVDAAPHISLQSHCFTQGCRELIEAQFI